MEKQPMCRICFAQNVRMYTVVNRKLHELYEKLTDIPFVTEDSRPILACFICCTKLKQCYRLLRQCLEAEELFAKRMNEDYEPNPLINPGHFGFYSGFIKSPTENISIVDDVLTESIDVKEELPAVCEELYVIIEPKKEHQDELENFDNSCLDVADILPHHSKSYLEDDVPLMEFKTEVEEEQEVSKKKRRATGTTKSIAVKEEPPAVCEGLYVIIEPKEEHQSDELEQENLDNSCLDVADILPHHSESDLEDDLPLMEFKTEVGEQEVSKKKRRATGTTRATVAKKRKLDTRRTNEKDAITAEQMRKNKSDSKIFRTTHKRTSKPGTYFKEPYKCDQDSFSVMGALTKHMLIHADEKPYKCDLCQRSFNEEGSLKNHIRVHTGDNHYKCDLSQHSISEEGSLKNPISVHTGDNPYKRDVCQRSFTEKSSLNNHIRIHTGEKPYKCDICGRRFSQLTSLKRHILIHTGEKPYKCSVCQRNFHEKDDLIKHVRTHTGEKPYKCDVCQRTFNQKSNLTNHIRIHTGDTPYKCDVCQRNFSHRGSLKYHNRIHAGENPYKCNVCQRSFSEKGSLKNHIRIHTGEKPYKCDICGRGFSQVSNLKSHIRIHTGEKPYKCDICGRGFAQVSNLKRHVLMHTGEKH